MFAERRALFMFALSSSVVFKVVPYLPLVIIVHLRFHVTVLAVLLISLLMLCRNCEWWKFQRFHIKTSLRASFSPTIVFFTQAKKKTLHCWFLNEWNGSTTQWRSSWQLTSDESLTIFFAQFHGGFWNALLSSHHLNFLNFIFKFHFLSTWLVSIHYWLNAVVAALPCSRRTSHTITSRERWRTEEEINADLKGDIRHWLNHFEINVFFFISQLSRFLSSSMSECACF